MQHVSYFSLSSPLAKFCSLSLGLVPGSLGNLLRGLESLEELANRIRHCVARRNAFVLFSAR